jgi:hypothetical protein
MKAKILMFMMFVLIASCDSPRSQRSVITSGTSQSAATTTTSGTSLTPTTGTVVDTGTTNTSGTTTAVIPSDATHCKFSTDGVNGFESTSTHLGSYTLCQSSSDKSIFYAQFKTPPVASSGDVNICFIPHTTSGTNSIYIGNPMCGSFSDPKVVKKITFVKYTQYSNALINSVMLFKDTFYYYPVFNRNMMTLDAYRTCMSMLSYGNTTYCESFKSVGQYNMKTF